MTRRDTPQSERRAALDAAIEALDKQMIAAMRAQRSDDPITREKAAVLFEELARHIRILSDMREEGPLL